MPTNAVGSRRWLACLVYFLLSAAIVSETDPRPASSEKLEHWPQVKRFTENDPPAIATPQPPDSALGNRLEHENVGGTIPTHLTHADSDADTAGQHEEELPGGGGDNDREGSASSSVVVSGRPKDVNSTACSTIFLEESIDAVDKSEQIISGELQVDDGYHGLDHPAVAIDVPELECECKDSISFEANTLEASACREGGEVYWILSVRGLVAGFEYKFDCEWFVLGTQNTQHWYTNFSSSTSSFAVRQPLSQISKTTGVWESYKQDHFEIEVTVRDMHPGLTNEDALIGTRRINSAVNTVRLKCAKWPATIHDKGFEHSIGQNGLDANSTGWRTSFETGVHVVEKSGQIISGELQVDNWYHGLDHPAVVVDSPVLECECKETWPPSLHELSSMSTCEHSVVLIVSVRGLVPQFVYAIEIEWSLESDKMAHTWRSVVKTETDTYTFREPLVQRNNDFLFGMMAWETYKNGNDLFFIEVTVCDMYPGLTTKEALVGIRNIDSSVNTVELKCAEQKSHGNGDTFPTHLTQFVFQSDADAPATGQETNAAIITTISSSLGSNHTLKNSGYWSQPGNRGNDQQERQVVEKLDSIGFDHRNPPSLLMHNDKKHLDPNFASSEDFQERLWDWQHPRSCVDSKLMIISWRHDSGLGSQLHLRAFNFVLGLNNNRVVVDDPGFPLSFGPVYKGAAVSDQNDSNSKEFCRSPQSFDCFFLPLSNCTVPLNFASHGAVKATVQNVASDERWVYLDGPDWMAMESFGFRGLSLQSKIFGQRSKSSHWWFSQMIRYIVRPNRFTVKYIMKPAFLSVFPNGPPSDLASLFIRLGDRHKESDIPSIESHFEDLVNPSLNITNLYVGSDSQKAIDEVILQYGQKFKIFYLNVERFRDGMTWETYTGIQKSTQLQQSGMNPLMILNISLMQLYLSVQRQVHVRASWKQLV